MTGVGKSREVFVKRLTGAPAGFFAAEARGLDWLRVPGGPPLPEVIEVTADALVLERIRPTPPSPGAAAAFGRALATMHRETPPSFGAAADGFIGPLPLPNAPAPSWPEFYVERRIRPYLAALSAGQRDLVEGACARIEDVSGPAEPPARIHGDLWSGNVLWTTSTCWLIDAAAAHGGHRETDLAMLALFGVPHLDRIVAAYDEVFPLSPGWSERQPLHQLHPLLVHAELFGGGYAAQAAAAARDALRLR